MEAPLGGQTEPQLCVWPCCPAGCPPFPKHTGTACICTHVLYDGVLSFSAVDVYKENEILTALIQAGLKSLVKILY